MLQHNKYSQNLKRGIRTIIVLRCVLTKNSGHGSSGSVRCGVVTLFTECRARRAVAWKYEYQGVHGVVTSPQHSERGVRWVRGGLGRRWRVVRARPGSEVERGAAGLAVAVVSAGQSNVIAIAHHYHNYHFHCHFISMSSPWSSS